MIPVTAARQLAAHTGQDIYYRVTALNPDLSEAAELTGVNDNAAGRPLFGGRVSMSRTQQVRRTLSLSLAKAKWPGASTDLFYLRKLVKVQRGVKIAGSIEYVTLGVFVVNRPQGRWGLSTASLQVGGMDRMVLGQKSLITAPETYLEGATVASVIQALLTGAGVGGFFRLNDGGQALRVDASYVTGTKRLDAAFGLADAFALDLYCAADGWVELKPKPTAIDPNSAVWTYTPATDSTLIAVQKELSEDDYANHTYVSGENSRKTPVWAEARDLNPVSPGYNPADGSGTFGDIVDMFTSSDVVYEDQAQTVADARLLEKGLIAETLSIEGAVVDFLEPGDVISAVHTDSLTNGAYVLDDIDVPFGPGSQSLDSRVVRALS